jgi:predicted DsbA family dithiol-disulfide isomerase
MELLKIKGENDNANGFMEDLYKSYFENGEDINDESKLKDKVTRYGVEETEAAFAMGENNLAAISRLDRQIKSTYGVNGVPFFMVYPSDGSPPITFSGAYPIETIAEQLKKASGS